jgi:uncharacterized membrane protein
MDSEKPAAQPQEPTGDNRPVAPNYAPAEGKVDGKFQVVDEQQLERVVQQVLLKAEAFSGPTPHPEHLERYERTFSGAAKIIFAEYQANSQHHREMEKGMLDLELEKTRTSHARDRASMNRAFCLVLSGMLVVALCAYFKQTTLGGIVAGTLLVAVLRSFLPKGSSGVGSKTPDESQPEKNEAKDGTSGKSETE